MNSTNARSVLIALELLIVACAWVGGGLLLFRLDGSALGLSAASLGGIFDDFLVPALALLLMGTTHLAAAAMNHMKRPFYDVVLSAVAGGMLVSWISVQVIIMGAGLGTLGISQLVFFLLGAAIFYISTELWREGEGPHLGLADGLENHGLTPAVQRR